MINFDHGAGEPGSLVVVDLSNGQMTKLDGFVASGSSVWSPDSRFLIGERRKPMPLSGTHLAIFDVDVGTTTSLPLDSSLAGAAVRGFLDAQHLVLSTRKQRVITLHAVDVESGHAVKQRTFRLPLPAGSAAPWLWAPQAVMEHPEALGLL